jgi:hypothetical protein
MTAPDPDITLTETERWAEYERRKDELPDGLAPGEYDERIDAIKQDLDL